MCVFHKCLTFGNGILVANKLILFSNLSRTHFSDNQEAMLATEICIEIVLEFKPIAICADFGLRTLTFPYWKVGRFENKNIQRVRHFGKTYILWARK